MRVRVLFSLQQNRAAASSRCCLVAARSACLPACERVRRHRHARMHVHTFPSVGMCFPALPGGE
ncbi:hypothetical protein EON67_01110 [archaeon]|nr:MAG: hypothetical protein EON67_01110 [archaeon]